MTVEGKLKKQAMLNADISISLGEFSAEAKLRASIGVAAAALVVLAFALSHHFLQSDRRNLRN